MPCLSAESNARHAQLLVLQLAAAIHVAAAGAAAAAAAGAGAAAALLQPRTCRKVSDTRRAARGSS
jgi:hypothetical protein